MRTQKIKNKNPHLTNLFTGANIKLNKGEADMYYVYFARGYANEEMIAECLSLNGAMARADEEYERGSRDIQVYDSVGDVVYEPTDEYLFDEF